MQKTLQKATEYRPLAENKSTEVPELIKLSKNFKLLHSTKSITRDRTNRPLLFRDRISNCTNLFRPKPNRTEPHTQIRASCRGSLTPQTRDVQILKCCIRISPRILTTDPHPHSPHRLPAAAVVQSI